MKLFQRLLTLFVVVLLLLICIYRTNVPGYQWIIESEYNSWRHEIHACRSSDPPPYLQPAAKQESNTHNFSSTHTVTEARITERFPPSYQPQLNEFFNRIFINPHVNLSTEQFTILILTYKRVALLHIVIPHYCTTGPKLQKVIIVWNDIDTDIPADIEHIHCEVPIVFIKSKENKLTNRFIPYTEIETDAVYFIDDDRKVLHEDLVFAFQSWQQFRHRILGYEQRLHTILNDGQYFYGDKNNALEKNGYSIVLSTNFILHKVYLEMYHMPEFLPAGIYNYVDEKMNCEDIAIAMMVTDFLQKYTTAQTCCLSLHAKHYPYNLEAKNRGSSFRGLSMRKTHVKGRTECLKDFVKFYKNGKLPLQYTHTRLIYEPIKAYYTEKKPF